MNGLTAVDLFSGLGAWAIACHATGIRTRCFVEKDPRRQAFLAKAWPGIPIYPDAKTFDGKAYRGADIIFGGVPCQPASRAGKQKGAGDDRWLWPEALRIAAEVRPRVCLFENPPGIEDVGLDGILAALEGEGYEIGPVFDIPACAVNSPQLRHRYYIIAVANAERAGLRNAATSGQRGTRTHERRASQSDVANGVRSGSKNALPLRPGRPRQGENDHQRLDASDVAHSNGDGQGTCGRPATEVPDQRSRRALFGVGQADTESQRRHGRRERPEQTEGSGEECSANGLRAEAWDDYIWVPCADGKVRRAPGDTVSLVDGLHRSILGALGDSQVPQVAEIICRAIKAQLETLK